MGEDSKFEFLFEDAKRRHNHQEKLRKIVSDAECTFHPNIWQSRQPGTFSTHRNKEGQNQSPVAAPAVERGKIDPSTGQKYFTPKVGRPPKKNRNAGRLSIGEYLYSQKKRKDVEKQPQPKASVNMSYMQEESKRILEGKKAEAFAAIFARLDKDADGVITAKSVNIAGTRFETG